MSSTIYICYRSDGVTGEENNRTLHTFIRILSENLRLVMEVTGGERSSLTKQSVRLSVLENIEERDQRYPTAHGRIPNFRGAAKAASRLAGLEEFQAASVIKVNLDKAQEEVRYEVLLQEKELLVATPKLSYGLFHRLVKRPADGKAELRVLASSKKFDKKSEQVELGRKVSIDLVVVGSVAVDRQGRRVGAGGGFSDLEFALAAQMHGAVRPDTVVVTTVHDCQLVDSLPAELFSSHDVPVDVIVTPSAVHRVTDRLDKRLDIVWDIISEEKIRQIPVLSLLKTIMEGETSITEEHLEIVKETKKKKRRRRKRPETHGFVFSGIPRETRISDFKEAVRRTGARLTFVTWKGNRGASKAFFEGDIRDIVKCLEDFKVGDQTITVTEIGETSTENCKENIGEMKTYEPAEFAKKEEAELPGGFNEPSENVEAETICEIETSEPAPSDRREETKEEVLDEKEEEEVLEEKEEEEVLDEKEEEEELDQKDEVEVPSDEPEASVTNDELKVPIIVKDENEKQPSPSVETLTSIPSYCDLIRDVQISADRRNFSNNLQAASEYLPSSYLRPAKEFKAQKQKEKSQDKQESTKTESNQESQTKKELLDKPPVKTKKSHEEAATKKAAAVEKQASSSSNNKPAADKGKTSEKIERSNSKRNKVESKEHSVKTGNTQEVKAPESQRKHRKSPSSKSKSSQEDSKSDKSRPTKQRTPSLPRAESSKDSCLLS